MRRDVSRKTLLREAQKLASQLKATFPQIETRVSLEPQEDEDAIVWVTAPEELKEDLAEDLMMESAGLTVDLYEERGIYIPAHLTSWRATDAVARADADPSK